MASVAGPLPAESDMELDSRALRVVIAHDWMVSYAGSERVVEALLHLFPEARLLTTLARRRSLPPSLRGAETSFLQRIPRSDRHHEWLLPLMPLAWYSRGVVDDVDIVISSSHACAKAIRVAAGIPHVCYCHTPMRYAWQFDEERGRFPAPLRPAARASMSLFRRWDRSTSRSVTSFVANSSAVAARIRDSYGRTSVVVHPPVDTEYFTLGGVRGKKFLYVGRLVSYKRADQVVEAFRHLDHELVVVGEGHLAGSLRKRATPNVTFEGKVTRERLRDLYRSARALVYPANEDFGIAMAEAQACGAPIIGLREGGALDIVQPGLTGWLVDDADPGSIASAVELAAATDLDHARISASAGRFSVQEFERRMSTVVSEALQPSRR
jgi:glycosyltransferase involved in cell wall biosynthesis